MAPSNPHQSRADISVQIVHIEGPRKGEIDESTSDVITIGRLPNSTVAFSKDTRIISRKHAEIKREGNRFILINHSPNGCFINTQQADNVYLKQGDVITFAEGGPKVSFLYSILSPGRSKPPPPPPPPPVKPPRTSRPQPIKQPVQRPASPVKSSSEAGQFTIQYGTSIKSFKQHSVRLGKAASNDFVLNHARAFDVHSEIYFTQGQYFLKDLTDSHQTLINKRAIHADTPIHDNDVISFSEGGPELKYLGTGRFAEVID